MHKPILINDSINFKNFFYFILETIKKYFKFFIYLSILFSIYFFFIKVPAYSSAVSFYTNYDEEQTFSSFGIISSMAGLSSNNNLGFSISNYVKSDRFLEDVVREEYDINDNKKTLVDHWSKDYNQLFSFNPFSLIEKLNKRFALINNLSNDEKKLIYVKEKLSEAIEHSEDRLTSLHKITLIIDENSKLSEQISQTIFESIVNYSTSVTNIKATEKKEFISSRIIQVKKDLEKSEETLKIFLENNKFISSPALVLQQGRIEREILLYSQLYLSLSDQLEIAKIDEKDTTSSIYLLDKPILSPYKSGISFFEGLLFINIIVLSFFLILSTYNNRKNLFIYKV